MIIHNYHKVNFIRVVNVNGIPHGLIILIRDLANLTAGKKCFQLILCKCSALILINVINLLLQLLRADTTCVIHDGNVLHDTSDEMLFVAALLLLSRILMEEEGTNTKNKYAKHDKQGNKASFQLSIRFLVRRGCVINFHFGTTTPLVLQRKSTRIPRHFI